MKRFISSALALVALIIICSLVRSPTVSAQPGANLSGVVSATKATWTPQVNVGSFQDGQNREVWDFEALPGGVMVACGKFEQVKVRGSSTWTTRNSLFSFYTAGANRGKLTSFTPSVRNGADMGIINKCESSIDGKSLIIAGAFTSVNGKAVQNLAKIRLSDSAVLPFAKANAQVTDIIKIKNNRFIACGRFTSVDGVARTGIASIARSGKVDNYFTSKLTGTISPSAGKTGAYRCISTGNYMAAIVNSSKIDNKNRRHLAVWNLGSTKATLRNWVLKQTTSTGCQNFMVGRGLDTVKTTNDIILVTTGGPSGGICDRTLRIPLAGSGTVTPRWMNKTCGDTLHSVAATTPAIYVQGHHKCVQKTATSSSSYVDRLGIAALNYKGTALNWRSDQDRCVGSKAAYVVSASGHPKGLLTGSDCNEGIVFRPL